jgi:hypothetical protein
MQGPKFYLQHQQKKTKTKEKKEKEGWETSGAGTVVQRSRKKSEDKLGGNWERPLQHCRYSCPQWFPHNMANLWRSFLILQWAVRGWRSGLTPLFCSSQVPTLFLQPFLSPQASINPSWLHLCNWAIFSCYTHMICKLLVKTFLDAFWNCLFLDGVTHLSNPTNLVQS